jgi:hypothetical protein
MTDRANSATATESAAMSRKELVRAHFEAYRDLMWAEAMEPRLKGCGANAEVMKPYREAWNAFVEDRDWDWWRDEVRRTSDAELEKQLVDCIGELRSMGPQECQQGRTTTRLTFNEILHGEGSGHERTVEPMPEVTREKQM